MQHTAAVSQASRLHYLRSQTAQLQGAAATAVGLLQQWSRTLLHSTHDTEAGGQWQSGHPQQKSVHQLNSITVYID